MRAGRLAHSLVIKHQRALLDRIGAEVGTPVVYLKAAWADPVLYGGLGERAGCDLDVLVRRDRFRAFARRLCSEGFRRVFTPGWRVRSELAKEWLLSSEGGHADVDVHRRLSNWPWFRERSDELIARAVPYPSVDGSVLSLCPEDQFVYAAVHHANSFFRLDGRHLEDTRRLVERSDVDWDETWRRARAAAAEVPLMLLVTALRAKGAELPLEHTRLGAGARLRLRVAERFIDPHDGLRRRATRSKLVEYSTLMPALSGRAAAWPRYVGTSVILRSVERLYALGRTHGTKHDAR